MKTADIRALAAAALVALSTGSQAQFAGYVIPARFELKAKAGEVIRQTLEVGSDAAAPSDFRIRTADWRLLADGGVDYTADTLEPESCRPWVRLERYLIRIAPRAKRLYRFEVHVPPDARPGLCRFALLLESASDALEVTPLSNLRIPVQGRIGVIVYVRIGDARPNLAYQRLEMRNQGGVPMPFAVFMNTGNAHARPEGFLTGTDGSGKEYDFLVSSFPILPGETRGVPIAPQPAMAGTIPRLVAPVRLRGTIEWDGGKQEIDAEAR